MTAAGGAMREDLKSKERWQRRGVYAGSLVALTVLGVPAVMTVISPALVIETEAWRPLGSVDSFPLDEFVKVEVRAGGGDSRELAAKAVYVRRGSGGDWVVFSRNCTDLSCPITWDPGSQCFYCPCHGGIFDSQGVPMAGPPTRPLYRYATRVRDGILEIDVRSLPPMT